MKEDLAEWLNTLYDLDITTDTFMDGLDTGCALCRHANNVNRAALDFQLEHPEAARPMKMPCKDVVFQSRNVVSGSFLARDNVTNFITWCRQELWIKDVLMFETNDLVERCNEKNFVLCLLEVARRGAKFGMLAPMLIQLEEEIEEEIRDQEIRAHDHPREAGEAGKHAEPGSPPGRCYSREEIPKSLSPEDEPDETPFVWQQRRVLLDMRNLDELVREILGRCSCPGQFPMTKVSEGKYKVGDSSALIFIRVLRTHVMVRVGGGWDTLEHYLDKHDPCRCAAFAHRYHQAKASNQGGHSKSSSAHSSRSTSPGPHWRNDAIPPHKTPDRRSLEPAFSSSSNRSGRSHQPLNEPEPGTGRPLLPRPPRDRSEPRQFNPLSDSSTASSKGGGGGGRYSLANPSRRSGDEVVLLVNRKEGKHVIERPGAGAAAAPAPRPPMPRARSQSRERSAPASILKPRPPQGPPDGLRNSRIERGRSLANEVPRRLQATRSHSQGKLPSHTRSSDASPGPASCYKDPQPPLSERREAKQVPPASPRLGGGFAKRQSSCSNSPVKGLQSTSSSPSKKTTVNPRPPAPRSPCVGKNRLLPPVTSGGRRSPHSSPRNSHHNHPPRSPRSFSSPRPAGRGHHHRGLSGPEHRQEEIDEDGPGFSIQMLPALDPQKEQDLYRSFEAEFLANTQQGRGGSHGANVPTQAQQGVDAPSVPAAADLNVTDSAYSSSNSSTSSLNVGTKMGTLPDLRESKRPIPHHFQLEDPLSSPHGLNPGGLHNGRPGEPEHWGERKGALKKLPAISSSMEEREAPTSSLAGLGDTEQTTASKQICPQATFNCSQLNGDCGRCPSGEALSDRQGHPRWGSGPEGDVPLPDHQPNLPYDMEDGEEDRNDLPGPEELPSPVALPVSEDCSYQDSSSENSSMCFSLSESHSESSPPPPTVMNGNADGGVVMRPKKGQKKSDRVPSIYKLKLRPRIRPRTDNRPDNSPSRIPTPVSYRDLQTHKALSPHSTPPLSPRTSRSNSQPLSNKALANMNNPHSHSPGNQEFSFPAQSGSMDADAWM
ncbi:hypothetical protein CRUP_035887 [Coryphaenoides rupestris]|nr:hypothetical protein CRUP_035887 [Coryphaenoides rupestris]